MLSRREVLSQAAAATAACFAPWWNPRSTPESEIILSEELTYLRQTCRRVISSATRLDTQDSLGFSAVTPGGDYPSLWIRDFSMAVGSGLISSAVIHQHLRAITASQNGAVERVLGDRARIPPFAIPDHINFEGGAVFYPGTYSAGEDQGGEPYGRLPPVDDHYEFIHIAAVLWRRTRNVDFLNEGINGMSLFNHLVESLRCPLHEESTGLVTTTAEDRAVGFGFCDGITITGSLLFPSLLRFRALGEMMELAQTLRMGEQVAEWAEQRRRIGASIGPTFLKDGWLIAGTGIGRQPDVWGTAFAIYVGAVAPALAAMLGKTLAKAVRDETIVWRGAVRHVPTDHDFSPESAWEKTAGEQLNRYQNGAYWHVPTGWLVSALSQTDPDSARKIVLDMMEHLREEEASGAPWECLHPDGGYRQNPLYMASVTLPYEVLKEMAGR